MQKNYILLHQC